MIRTYCSLLDSFLPQDRTTQAEPVIGYKPTISGLALWLGLKSRTSFYDYANRKKDKEKFAYIIKRAAFLIEMNYEQLLESKGATGAIFALKNMGWHDKQQITNVNHDVPLTEEELQEAKNKLDEDY